MFIYVLAIVCYLNQIGSYKEMFMWTKKEWSHHYTIFTNSTSYTQNISDIILVQYSETCLNLISLGPET